MARSKTKTNNYFLFWSRFDPKRTREAGGSADFMLRGHVSLTIRAGSTHREDLEEIAQRSSQPFAIASISTLLNERRSLRGTVYFGEIGRQIDDIVRNYPQMRWWMTKSGLVVDIALPEAAELAEFDREGGKLACERTVNGRLTAEAIAEIAGRLDAAGFSLSMNLQRAQWKPIAEYNKKYPKSAIKTFSSAARHRQFSRAVRRRLYVARNRYKTAYGSFRTHRS